MLVSETMTGLCELRSSKRSLPLFLASGPRWRPWVGTQSFLVQSAPSLFLLANLQVEFKRIVSTSCIRFLTIHLGSFFGPCVDPLADSGVCNMRNGEITPLLPEAVIAELQRKRQFLTLLMSKPVVCYGMFI